MMVTKCDLCKKEIKNEQVTAGFAYSRKELCQNCGIPILKFLEKHKFIKKEGNKFKKI